MPRRTRITSTTHALAVAVYAVMGVIGALWATGSTPTASMARMYGDGFDRALGVIVIVTATIVFGATLLSLVLRRPVPTLWIEMAGCIVLATSFGLYWRAIYGSGAVTTEWVMCAFAVGSAARAVQIGYDLLRIR